jgi:hypothetical protein
MIAPRAKKAWLHRLFALALTGVVLGLGVAAIGAPVASALREREAAGTRLTRLEIKLKPPGDKALRYNPDDLSGRFADDAAAQVALQSALNKLANGASTSIGSIRPLGAEDYGRIGRAIWVDVAAKGDLQSLTDLLEAMDAQRPTVLVRRIDMTPAEGAARPDAALQLRIEAGLIWRPEGPSK